MADTDDIFQKALDLGERELGCLREKDVRGADSLARERKALMERLFASGADDGELRYKLEQLQHQQTHLTREARELRELLKKEILRVQGQGKRYGGYRHAANVTPLSSRFVNKKG
jgi:hypothetical protein